MKELPTREEFRVIFQEEMEKSGASASDALGVYHPFPASYGDVIYDRLEGLSKS